MPAFKIIFYIYLLGSIAAFCQYWLDREAEANGKKRIRTLSFHVVAALGGWPGALLAQKMLKHRNGHSIFNGFVWMSIALNLCLVYVAFHPDLIGHLPHAKTVRTK